jgi:hypothetical protein
MAEKGIVYRLGWALYWSPCIPAVISLLVAAFGLVGSVYGLIVGWPARRWLKVENLCWAGSSPLCFLAPRPSDTIRSGGRLEQCA